MGFFGTGKDVRRGQSQITDIDGFFGTGKDSAWRDPYDTRRLVRRGQSQITDIDGIFWDW